MEQLQQLYESFLNFFPAFLHPIISLLLAALLVYSIFQTLRKNFIFLIILAVLLPASIPILHQAALAVIAVVRFLTHF